MDNDEDEYVLLAFMLVVLNIENIFLLFFKAKFFFFFDSKFI